ncbi:hypothetical protein DPMN_110074 [Dreissena polymorpha]|uniref:Uncharacterized protein n=1 Tax=Dreissena polymorpha TaxID=45954 RepID=A0A9D4QML3_DREPO|nr:hypothetical protein DPMN_110074 [Dreissena polymorpha]
MASFIEKHVTSKFPVASMIYIREVGTKGHWYRDGILLMFLDKYLTINIGGHDNLNDNQSRRCNLAEDVNHYHNNGLQQESQQVFNYYGSTECEQDWCERQQNVVNSREIHNKRYQHNSVNRPENQYSVNNIWKQQNEVNSGNQYRVNSEKPKEANDATLHRVQLTMPPFTGKEGCETWRAQFEAKANRYGWDEEERLNQLLPRLEGAAA